MQQERPETCHQDRKDTSDLELTIGIAIADVDHHTGINVAKSFAHMNKFTPQTVEE